MSSSNSNSPAPIEQSRRFTRELHSRLVHRFPALFADLTPGAVVRHHPPSSLLLCRAYRRLPPNGVMEQVPTPQGTPSYGATNGAPVGDGMQKLGADASKIEPKVPSDHVGSSCLVISGADLSLSFTQVWLASERTLLSWFRVALLLSSFALALFNSASDQDWASKTMGVIYAVIACAMLGYAWTMHRIRRYRIVMRYGGHHGAFLPSRLVRATVRSALCSRLTF